VNSRHVARAPSKPVMLFDGDCHFCTLWIRRWHQSTGDTVDYLPLQNADVSERFPELSRADLERAVHLVNVDGSVSEGAAAVFQSLAASPAGQIPLRLYRGLPWFATAAECAYRFVARHRVLSGWATRILWGDHVEKSPDMLVRWLFLKGLGAIYLIAFVSFWVQITGLIGAQGILPAANWLSRVRQVLEAEGAGMSRFRLFPTLCWIGSSDGFLRFQCGAGAALALALMAGLAPRFCLAGLWLLYLSLTSVGQVFLGYQWDNLLLEAGLLAILFAPCHLLPRLGHERPPRRTALWLLRLLLFKLMFLSGLVKLANGDVLWRNLTALTRHYETQPLPTWIGWYAYQLPVWFHKMSCVLMFTIELGAPFLIFAPRRPRMLGGLLLVSFQVLILLTGNYTFFNWLTLLLCLLLFDDFALARLLPRKLSEACARAANGGSASPLAPPRLRWQGPIALAALLYGSISALQIGSVITTLPAWTSPIMALHGWLSPFRSINSYGLFAVMTPDRPEIIVEGSNDGRSWKPYEFPWKPGALDRRPAFVAPHQPRLDWQMWFAALGDVRHNPWFVSFCIRLLQGSPAVLGLLDKNPFPDAPPKYIRARVYDYHFTSLEERRRTGNWWKRELVEDYLPPISLEMLRPAPRQEAGEGR
jgi:predicted DCC family thiol-disulfide oxidoreductase YuxK